MFAKKNDGSYAVLNREYKPVGFNTRDHIDYKDFPVTTQFKGIGLGIAKKISYNGSEGTETIYLYDDGCVPTQSTASMNSYLEKLRILAKLRVIQ